MAKNTIGETPLTATYDLRVCQYIEACNIGIYVHIYVYCVARFFFRFIFI